MEDQFRGIKIDILMTKNITLKFNTVQMFDNLNRFPQKSDRGHCFF